MRGTAIPLRSFACCTSLPPNRTRSTTPPKISHSTRAANPAWLKIGIVLYRPCSPTISTIAARSQSPSFNLLPSTSAGDISVGIPSSAVTPNTLLAPNTPQKHPHKQHNPKTRMRNHQHHSLSTHSSQSPPLNPPPRPYRLTNAGDK